MHYIQIFLLILICTQALSAADFQRFFRKLNLAAQIGDVSAYVELMQELEGFDGLSFGEGAGPESQQSMRLRVVVSAWPHLISADEDLDAVDVSDLDAWTRKVVMAARRRTDDQQMIVDLLRNEDLSLRWVGLQLIPGTWDEIPEEVREIVTLIATSDPYIIINFQFRQRPPGGMPPPPGSRDNVMVAPLRETAQRIPGQPAVAASRNRLDAEGALRMIEIAEMHPEQIAPVFEALRRLKPEGEVVLAIQELIAADGTLEELKAMVRDRLEAMGSSEPK